MAASARFAIRQTTANVNVFFIYIMAARNTAIDSVTVSPVSSALYCAWRLNCYWKISNKTV